jgi:hypothetical protein
MKRGLMVACFAAMLVAGRLADAAVINGQFVPDSLVNTPGAKYRIIFVTSGSINGLSNQVSTYNNFINQQVAGTMLDTGFNYGWQAVMSTASGDQIAKNVMTGPDAIYNMAGQQVANSGSAMLAANHSGSVLLLNAIGYDQNGTSASEGYVWTGSMNDGSPAYNIAGITADLRVGSYSSGTSPGTTMLGASASVNEKWLRLTQVGQDIVPGIPFVARVYAVSDVLTAVPEPSTIALWSICAGAVGLVAWRKRRKSS